MSPCGIPCLATALWGRIPEVVKTSLLVLLAAVGLMLAVACANVANLLLARYSSRRREIAVRASLGADRGRVIRQLLTESLLLSLAGGICGMILARWGVSGLLALAPANLTQSVDIHIDSRIFVFAIGLSMLTGISFRYGAGARYFAGKSRGRSAW